MLPMICEAILKMANHAGYNYCPRACYCDFRQHKSKNKLGRETSNSTATNREAYGLTRPILIGWAHTRMEAN